MEFKRTKEFGVASGTSLQGYINIAPKTLVDTFGKPDEGDYDKVSTEFVFVATHNPNIVFTLYDYKRYGSHASVFQKSKKPFEFHIGGFSKQKHVMPEFIEWVERKTNLRLSGETLSADELISHIAEVLAQADGEYIEGVANLVLAKRVTYLGDSLFSVKENE